MDEIFKRHLLNLRTPKAPKSFGDAIWNSDLPRTRVVVKKPTSVSREGFSEKAQVLESLERFAEEKTRESSAPVIKFDGGEIVLKGDPLWDESLVVASAADLETALSLPESFKNLILQNKIPGPVKVIFVPETFRAWTEVTVDLREGMINEFLTVFPSKTAELFERMVTAMKLSSSEVVVYPIEADGRDVAPEIIRLASWLKPEIIITLGAKATQRLLGAQERLSLIHGQFFPRNIKGQVHLNVVPLFHPSILETNQNMKKTAWADMQKIMRHLKKLP